jgi:hypothetical protein
MFIPSAGANGFDRLTCAFPAAVLTARKAAAPASGKGA